MPNENDSSVLHYAARRPGSPVRRTKWWLMTVFGWLFAIYGGGGIIALTLAIAILLVSLARARASGNVVITDPEIYWVLSRGVLISLSAFFLGLWLLLRQRRIDGTAQRRA